jgi:hypothetical protein
MNVPQKNFGFTPGNRPVEDLIDFDRRALKEHVFHFEVLDFDVSELQSKKLMNVFIATPSANVHIKELMPHEWTAAHICQHYQAKYPSLAGECLWVLLISSNRLHEQLSGNYRILDKMHIDNMRVEITPPSHMDVPPQSVLVPVQLCNKNSGSYILTSLIPHPFYIRIDPGTTSTTMLRDILSGSLASSPAPTTLARTNG